MAGNRVNAGLKFRGGPKILTNQKRETNFFSLPIG